MVRRPEGRIAGDWAGLAARGKGADLGSAGRRGGAGGSLLNRVDYRRVGKGQFVATSSSSAS